MHLGHAINANTDRNIEAVVHCDNSMADYTYVQMLQAAASRLVISPKIQVVPEQFERKPSESRSFNVLCRDALYLLCNRLT